MTRHLNRTERPRHRSATKGRHAVGMLAAGILSFLIPAAASPARAGAPYRSPREILVSPVGTDLFIAEATAQRVTVFDPVAGRSTRDIPLPGPPGGIALSPDGATLYVTHAAPQGRVWVIHANSGAIVRAIPVGHSPVAAVLSRDGTTLYVCNQFDHDVSVVDLAAGREVDRIPVRREPVAATLTPDGQQLLVANLLPAGPANGDYSSAEVTIIDVAGRAVQRHVALPNGSHSVQGVVVSPDGRFAYLTHILSRYQVPTTQLERGWINTNALSILDLLHGTLYNTVLLDDVDRGAANPWAVALSADGRHLCVTHAGTHELSVIQRKPLHEKLDRLQRGESVTSAARTFEDAPNDLAFLTGLRTRVPLEVRGPRGLAVRDHTAYITGYFSDSVSVVPLESDGPLQAHEISLGTMPEMDTIRKGEFFFSDASRCFQQWQSCVSCHPGIRADALNWDLLNDGIGNPKNTKSMLHAHQTPPAMISGIRDRAETAVRAGIRYIEFAVWPEEDAAAIDAFLSSLKPVPSPFLENGTLSESAQRGEQVFAELGCLPCHPPPFYTDLLTHDVGSGTGREKDRPWDTPTLVESWRTAPYLHDGRSATIDDLLRNERHGLADDLHVPKDEMDDLVEYVLSL